MPGEALLSSHGCFLLTLQVSAQKAPPWGKHPRPSFLFKFFLNRIVFYPHILYFLFSTSHNLKIITFCRGSVSTHLFSVTPIRLKTPRGQERCGLLHGAVLQVPGRMPALCGRSAFREGVTVWINCDDLISLFTFLLLLFPALDCEFHGNKVPVSFLGTKCRAWHLGVAQWLFVE